VELFEPEGSFLLTASFHVFPRLSTGNVEVCVAPATKRTVKINKSPAATFERLLLHAAPGTLPAGNPFACTKEIAAEAKEGAKSVARAMSEIPNRENKFVAFTLVAGS